MDFLDGMKSLSDFCDEPLDPGLCRRLHYMFGHEDGKCTQFNYGGCGGNKNKFYTIEECEKACL